MIKFLTLALIYVAVVFNLYVHYIPSISDVPVNTAMIMEQNRVALLCGNYGGQGTIYNVDQTGTWVLTARHVVEGQSQCDVTFSNMSLHTGYVSKLYNKSDEAILFLPRASWSTHAAIRDLTLGENLYAFGPIKPHESTEFPAFMWEFDNTIHEGKAIMPVIGWIIKKLGYPANSENLIYTSVYTNSGSSGGGVYDAQGYLVGLVSGGSTVDHNRSMIVDIEKSFESEP